VAATGEEVVAILPLTRSGSGFLVGLACVAPVKPDKPPIMKYDLTDVLTIMVAGALSFGITIIIWGIMNHG
jgi:hypothetical protein